MNYNNNRQNAHNEIDHIFKDLLPTRNMAERPEQVVLSHQMLDAMLDGGIALCDAGTGIGKTYAYLVAGTVYSRFRAASSEEIPLCSVPASGEDSARSIPSSSPHRTRCAAVGGFAALRMRRTPCGCFAGLRRGPQFQPILVSTSSIALQEKICQGGIRPKGEFPLR